MAGRAARQDRIVSEQPATRISGPLDRIRFPGIVESAGGNDDVLSGYSFPFLRPAGVPVAPAAALTDPALSDQSFSIRIQTTLGDDHTFRAALVTVNPDGTETITFILTGQTFCTALSTNTPHFWAANFLAEQPAGVIVTLDYQAEASAADVTKAVFDLLVADTALGTMLAKYQGAPAVFSEDQVPEDASFPYLVVPGEFETAAFDSKTTLGRDSYRDIRIYDDRQRDPALGSRLVDQVAERVRTLLHRTPPSISGFDGVLAGVRGPIRADEDDVFGRIVTLRLILEETTS